MEWKINEWDEGTGKEKKEKCEAKCEACGGKLERHKRHRQILTLVSDIDYDRYMYYCPNCKKTEYPLVLGLSPYQRMSPAVEELIVQLLSEHQIEPVFLHGQAQSLDVF